MNHLELKSYDSKIDKQREIAWLKNNNQPQIVISTPEKRLIDLSQNGLNYNYK